VVGFIQGRQYLGYVPTVSFPTLLHRFVQGNTVENTVTRFHCEGGQIKHASLLQYEGFVCTCVENDLLSVHGQLATQFSLVLPQPHYLIK